MIVQHMYQNPASQIAAAGGDPSQLDPKKVQEEFDEFYEEVYDELAGYGEIEELNVCENLGDHMVGNVRCKFADEEHSDAALKALFGRFYAGRPLVCEFSPVTDFREARCRQYDEAVCTRGGYCNFMHIRTPSRSLRKDLARKKKWRKAREKRGARSAASGSSATTAGRARAAARAAARATRARGRRTARARARATRRRRRSVAPRLPPARTRRPLLP